MSSQSEKQDEMDHMETDQEISKKTLDENSDVTFKTPSFIIPSKKKIQSNLNTSEAFKSPPLPCKPVKASEIGDPLKNEEKVENKLVDRISNSDADKALTEDPPKVKPSVKKSQTLSPAEQIKQAQTAIPYKEPPWSSTCEEKFSFEVIKNGAVIDNIDLSTKTYHVIGRLPSCDVTMEHPSLSRHHAVVQYSGGSSEQFPKGWYLYDLDSTHGTWINKNKVPPQRYHKIHVDYVMKFGGSTR